MNIALLSKWLWRYGSERYEPWRQLISGKYGEAQIGLATHMSVGLGCVQCGKASCHLMWTSSGRWNSRLTKETRFNFGLILGALGSLAKFSFLLALAWPLLSMVQYKIIWSSRESFARGILNWEGTWMIEKLRKWRSWWIFLRSTRWESRCGRMLWFGLGMRMEFFLFRTCLMYLSPKGRQTIRGCVFWTLKFSLKLPSSYVSCGGIVPLQLTTWFVEKCG